MAEEVIRTVNKNNHASKINNDNVNKNLKLVSHNDLRKAKKVFVRTLHDFIIIFFRRFRILLYPVLILPICFGIYSIFLPDIYKSSTTVLVEDRAFLKQAVAKVSLATNIKDKLNLIRTSILGWNNIHRVVKELGMDVEAGIKNNMEMEKFIARIRRNTSISYRGRSGNYGLIRIGFAGRDPVILQKFVNLITQRYVEQQLERQRTETLGAIEFIKQLLEKYRLNIVRQEEKVLDYQNKMIERGLPSGSLAEGDIDKDLMEYRDRHRKLLLRLEMVEQKKRIIEKQLKGEKQVIRGRGLNPVAADIEREILKLQNSYDELSFRYTPSHPRMIELQDMIGLKKKRLDSMSKNPFNPREKEVHTKNPVYLALKKQLHEAELEIESIRKKEQFATDVVEEKEALIYELRRQEQEFTALTRDSAVDKSIYAELRLRLENARITQRIESGQEGTRFEILDPARLPLIPYGPNRIKVTFMGFVFGFLIGAGLIVIVEQNDHSIRGVNDALVYIGDTPLLGSIQNYLTDNELRANRQKLKIKVACLIIGFIVMGLLLVMFRLKIYEFLSR